MSSDSSDEENVELLREAQDSQFINDSMFSDKQDRNSEVQNKVVLPSLRKSKDEDEQFNLFRVTPEFRRYVAKQLSAVLDDKLVYKNRSIPEEVNQCKSLNGGVKLFSDSVNYLSAASECPPPECDFKQAFNSKKRRASVKNYIVSTEDIKAIAVSGEKVLSQVETKHWSKRSKAPIFQYKKDKNGQLLLVGSSG